MTTKGLRPVDSSCRCVVASLVPMFESCSNQLAVGSFWLVRLGTTLDTFLFQRSGIRLARLILEARVAGIASSLSAVGGVHLRNPLRAARKR